MLFAGVCSLLRAVAEGIDAVLKTIGKIAVLKNKVKVRGKKDGKVIFA